jgi:hypothetical protein
VLLVTLAMPLASEVTGEPSMTLVAAKPGGGADGDVGYVIAGGVVSTIRQHWPATSGCRALSTARTSTCDASASPV